MSAFDDYKRGYKAGSEAVLETMKAFCASMETCLKSNLETFERTGRETEKGDVRE